MSDCPIPDQQSLSTSDVNSGISIALKAMGIQSCKTTTAAGGIVSLFPPGVGGAGATTSTGCEQVSAMSAAIAATQNVVTCTLNKVEADQVTTITQNNVINITYTGSIPIIINTSQINSSNITAVTQLDADQKLAIASSLTTGMQTFFDNAQKSKTGWLSTAEGAKSVKTLKTNLTQNVLNTVANTVIDSQIFTVTQGNTVNLTLTIGDPIVNSVISNPTANITQQNMTDYQAYQIVSTFFDQAFSTKEAGTFKTDFKNAADNESEGAASVIGALFSGGIVLLLFIVGGFVLVGGETGQTITKYIIPIGFVVSLIATIVLVKKKETTAAIISGVSAAAFAGLGAYSVLKIPATRKKTFIKR
jgi:hypothetical protein